MGDGDAAPAVRASSGRVRAIDSVHGRVWVARVAVSGHAECMCGRYASARLDDELAHRFHVSELAIKNVNETIAQTDSHRHDQRNVPG